MSTSGLSAHGTLLSVQLTPGGAWTALGEQGDLTPPQFSRNEFEATTQNENIDSFILGVLRRSSITLPINWIPSGTTTAHDHLTGVQKLMIDNTITGWKIAWPTVGTSGLTWVLSGAVQSFKPTAPVDGKLAAEIVVRPSGQMLIGGVAVGA